MNWQEGRRLVSATNGTTSLSFTYDSEGLRLTKTVGSTVYHYYYAGGKLIRQTKSVSGSVTETLDFFYDHLGHPYALKHKVGGVYTTYYYITNLQGDVLSIINSSGTAVATYTYDPYGKVLTAAGTFAATNPLRYRGYVYDTETGLYYLQSRYYDPTTGRFLNADAFASTGQGILGNNMFAYCLNNPVNYRDTIGRFATEAWGDLDGDPTGNEDELRGGSSTGVGYGSAWSGFKTSLSDAAKGLNMALGEKSGIQNHHIVSNKNKKYTPQFTEITDAYGLDLDDEWNIRSMDNHSGRHTNQYHEFVLDALYYIDSVANGRTDLFMEGIEIFADFISNNNWLTYAR